MMRTVKHAAIDAALALSRTARLHAVPILMYHAIDDGETDLCVSPRAFREQMAWLRAGGFRAITLGEYASALTGPGLRSIGRGVVITFDDGYVNNFEHALPVLAEHGFVATLFIATGHAGRATGWLERQWPVMTWDQIAACADVGHTIGAHTVTHPHLDELPPVESRREMDESRREIEQRLGRACEWLCYPYGGHTAETERLAREIGFHGAVSVKGGNTNRPEDLYRLRRFYVGPRTDLRHFALATSRLHAWKHSVAEWAVS